MKYGWFLILIGLLGAILLSNLSIGRKNQLVSLVSSFSFNEGADLRRAGQREFLVVKVFSTYPFNHKNLAAVAAGSKDGVKLNMNALVSGERLFGKIVEVSGNQSIIRTIFDPNWSLPVRIGNQETDALLVGGQEPRLTTIEKNRIVSIGDRIYSASKDFGYGLFIGTVGDIDDLPGVAFREADVTLDYEFNNLRELWLW